jgi:MarR family transcriptional regulator, organic hydroperoxide resistance regulator
MQSIPPGSVLLALQRATHVTLHRVATVLVDLDLTSAELNALANLAGVRGRTVSQLGTVMGIRPTTLTSVLDRLERRGHITRGKLAGDRRAVLVELTAQGGEVALLVTRTLGEIEGAALGGLTSRDLTGFHAVLRALTTARS